MISTENKETRLRNGVADVITIFFVRLCLQCCWKHDGCQTSMCFDGGWDMNGSLHMRRRSPLRIKIIIIITRIKYIWGIPSQLDEFLTLIPFHLSQMFFQIFLTNEMFRNVWKFLIVLQCQKLKKFSKIRCWITKFLAYLKIWAWTFFSMLQGFENVISLNDLTRAI